MTIIHILFTEIFNNHTNKYYLDSLWKGIISFLGYVLITLIFLYYTHLIIIQGYIYLISRYIYFDVFMGLFYLSCAHVIKPINKIRLSKQFTK